jgi:hypothetical protein
MTDLVQEIGLRGGGIFQTIRQSDNKKLHEGDLVFVYPVVIDTTLDKMYGKDIRDFISYQLINRVKQANLFNVVSSAVSEPQQKQDNGLNPAQALLKHLGNSIPQEQLQKFNYMDSSRPHQSEYERVLFKLREYILNQINHDPRFKDLNPIISEVFANNLIPVPLILGTSQLKVNSNVLFWVLFISAGQNINLTSNANLDRIKLLLRQIPKDNYEDFMGKDVIPDAFGNPRKLQQIINSIWDDTDKALSKFNLVLDEKKWNSEVGVNNFTASLSTAIQNSSLSEGTMARRASATFKNFVGNEVVGLLQSITHAIIPETEVDISSKLIRFVNSVSENRSHYQTLHDLTMHNIIKEDSVDQMDKLLELAFKICKENGDINVDKIFSQLNTLHFGITGKSNSSALWGSNSGEVLAKFVEGLIKVSSILASYSKNLEENIKDLGGIAALQELSDYKDHFRKSIEDYFRDGWETDQGITTTKDLQNPLQRMSNIGGSKFSLFDSKRFLQLTGQIDNDGVIRRVNGATQQAFEDNMFSSITEILHFLNMFSFLSYFCEYLREIEVEMTIQKRDATSFPNYCLVIRKEFISRIFWALATRNFENEILSEKNKDSQEFKNSIIGKRLNSELNALKNSLKSERDSHRKSQIEVAINDKEREINDASKVTSGIILDQFRIGSMSDTTKQINLIKERLKIPNIFVIDEKERKVYYKFMFNDRVMNLNLSTIGEYINSQKDFIASN